MTGDAAPRRSAGRFWWWPSVVLLLMAGVLAALVAGWRSSAGRGPDVALDRSDPVAVARAFAQRYAAGDPSMCELADDALEARLDRGGRCTAPRVHGQLAPALVVQAQTCGHRHGQSMRIWPRDPSRAPYLTVSVRRSGREWRVVAVLPVRDRAVIRPYACAEPDR